MFTLDYYALPNGRKPIEEFIDSLPEKMQAKAFYSLMLLEEFETHCGSHIPSLLGMAFLSCVSNLQATLHGYFTFSS